MEDRLVHITDLPVTVLRAARIDPSPDVEGIDLRETRHTDRVVLASLEYPIISLDVFPDSFSESGLLDPYKVELRAALNSRYKLIHSIEPSGQIVREEIYDLVNDPHETTPLEPAALDARILRRLRDALSANGGEQRAVPFDDLEKDVLEGPSGTRICWPRGEGLWRAVTLAHKRKRQYLE